jgi:ArsR family transcriptional regulator
MATRWKVYVTRRVHEEGLRRLRESCDVEVWEGEVSAGKLGHRLGMSPANLSQHLSMMKERRILVSRKEANAVYYRVSNPRLLEAFDILREILLEQFRRDAALVRQVA